MDRWFEKMFEMLDRPRKKQRQLALTRSEHTRQHFVEYFLGKGADEDIVRNTWAALEKISAVSGFVPAPGDDLLEVYGLAEEDLDEDLVLPLLESCSCRIPTYEETKLMPPVQTVEDLIQFVQSCKSSRNNQQA